MKLLLRGACASAVAAALAGAAAAQDTSGVGQDQGQGPSPAAAGAPAVSFNFGASSDYVFRGISQTDEEPQVFAGADVTAGQLYAGVWGTNVKFAGDDDTNVEVDLYGGWKPQAGGYTFELGGIYYAYLNQPAGASYDYFEAKAGVSRTIGSATIGGLAYWSPEFFGETDESLYLEANGAVPLRPGFTLSGAVGHQDVSYQGDYTTWNLGLGIALGERVTLDGRYWDTDGGEFGSIFEERFTLGLKAVF
jgi:uncharacterized protein (TIGR02001 family)